MTKEIMEDVPFWHNAEKTESEKTYDEFHILGTLMTILIYLVSR